MDTVFKFPYSFDQALSADVIIDHCVFFTVTPDDPSEHVLIAEKERLNDFLWF